MNKIVLLVSFLFINLFGANLHFSLYKKTTGLGPTLLVVGGIHGNEPGGYFAPEVLSIHYKVNYGNVWIIPNLNFDSIVRNRRGIYRDMNRKFASIKPKDKDFQIVHDVKQLILDKKVDMILNLHDGHGFYRKKSVNALCNPKAWGQACIIDQRILKDVQFGNLSEIAEQVSKESNIDLFEDVHEFNVKNTHTRAKDPAMRQSLTYFAIQHDKPAFAIETSKNIRDLDLKVYYQLKSIEEFMKIMGIKFTRDFKLNRQNIKKILQNYGMLEFSKGKISLPLNNLRPTLNYFPMSKILDYSSKNPLVALVKTKHFIKIMNGNILVTKLRHKYYKIDNSLHNIHMIVDKKEEIHQPGEIINIKKSFTVIQKEGYRVNVIGFSNSKNTLETNVKIAKKDIIKRFSIDKKANIYRIEFYKKHKFCGMILVRFK